MPSIKRLPRERGPGQSIRQQAKRPLADAQSGQRTPALFHSARFDIGFRQRCLVTNTASNGGVSRAIAIGPPALRVTLGNAILLLNLFSGKQLLAGLLFPPFFRQPPCGNDFCRLTWRFHILNWAGYGFGGNPACCFSFRRGYFLSSNPHSNAKPLVASTFTR